MRRSVICCVGCLLILTTWCGCGGKYRTYPVRGKVTLADGTPLPDVQVTFKSDQLQISATAVTDADGNYRLGTVKSGDGAPAGTYRVSVVDLSDVDDPDNPHPPRIELRYGHFQKSGLEFTVPATEGNYDIQLDAASGQPAPSPSHFDD